MKYTKKAIKKRLYEIMENLALLLAFSVAVVAFLMYALLH